MEMASKRIFCKNNVKSTLHSLTFLITSMYITYVRNNVKIICLLNGDKSKKAQNR